jgi:hypothetical protein
MRLSTVSMVGCAFALGIVGCKGERAEIAPPTTAVPGSKALVAASSSATGDEPERLCGAKSICPAEEIDDEGTKLCASLAREPSCGGQFLALVKCQIAQEKCGADGKTDQLATLDLCKVEEAALQACNQAKAVAPPAKDK